MTGILIDIDGVMYEGSHAVRGAAETVSFLRQHDIPYLFLTNTSSKPRSLIVQKLRLMGIEVDASEILTPAVAASKWIRDKGCQPVALLVPEDTIEDFKDISLLPTHLESGAKAVVLGDLGDEWDYQILNRAFRLLLNGDSQNPPILISLGLTRYFKSPSGMNLDVAPFTKALEHATGFESVVMGKPALEFFHQAADMMKLEPSDLIMIGDDILSDVHAAQHANIRGVLVKTGKFREEDLVMSVKPDAILGSIAELPEWLRKQRIVKRIPAISLKSIA